MARPFGLVVERCVPLKLAQQIGYTSLLSAGDELVQSPGDGGLLCALAADLNRAVEQIWIDCEIFCVPSTSPTVASGLAAVTKSVRRLR